MPSTALLTKSSCSSCITDDWLNLLMTSVWLQSLYIINFVLLLFILFPFESLQNNDTSMQVAMYSRKNLSVQIFMYQTKKLIFVCFNFELPDLAHSFHLYTNTWRAVLLDDLQLLFLTSISVKRLLTDTRNRPLKDLKAHWWFILEWQAICRVLCRSRFTHCF